MKIFSILIIVLFSMSLSAQQSLKDQLKNKKLSVPDDLWWSINKGNSTNRSEPFRLDSFNVWVWEPFSSEGNLLLRNIYSYNAEGLTDTVLELFVDNGNSLYSSLDSFAYDDEGIVVFRELSGWTGSD